ncbi:15150_t:CDS:2 [Funneliformis mosseae]|uniref:DNA-(apurinic or apyrimidinic site) endonuclease n=1 Tax=Funneliformis mosseae TaxID=27381 RepID=A0A9N8WIM6_FUNMO|nr:15150_t:CDS:2 [Funneliformis mosseae]
MRIITWNVNGIRSIINYYPWNKHREYKQILDTLNADIICFQETKVTIDKLDSSLAIIPGYDAYFSSSRGKGGYAGVVTYVRTSTVKPIAAEEGISGVLSEIPANAKSKDNMTTSGIKPSITSEFTTDELLEIDSEGRCVTLDFETFVLFNVYCVHESSQDRLPYKLKFYKILQKRVEALLDSGRQVIVIGDLNVTHKEIDHCDPQKSMKEYGLESFGDHPARIWFDSWVSPNGPMIDLCRKLHPDEEGMFTCLVKWFKSCDVKQDIMGSDHCPIFGELFDEIYEGDHKLSLFKEDALKATTPKLCAKNLARFSGNQQTLKSFFTKQDIREKQAQEMKLETSKISNDENVKKITSIIPSDSSSYISEGLKGQLELEGKTGTPLMSFFKKTIQEKSPEKKLELVNKSEEERVELDSVNISDSSNSPEESLYDMLDNEYERTEISPSNNKEEIQSQWNDLFKPRPIPNCIVHGESCKEYTVNKPGINQGRRFYLCSRPVGNSQESRCDYFEWVNGNKSKFSKPVKRSFSGQIHDNKSNKKKRDS